MEPPSPQHRKVFINREKCSLCIVCLQATDEKKKTHIFLKKDNLLKSLRQVLQKVFHKEALLWNDSSMSVIAREDL